MVEYIDHRLVVFVLFHEVSKVFVLRSCVIIIWILLKIECHSGVQEQELDQVSQSG